MADSGPVCMITGVGEGTGGYTAKRFAKGGYRVAMLARSNDRLKRLEEELEGSKGYECDVSDLNLLVNTCKKIKNDMGPPQVLIHNAVKGNFDNLLNGKQVWLIFKTNSRLINSDKININEIIILPSFNTELSNITKPQLYGEIISPIVKNLFSSITNAVILTLSGEIIGGLESIDYVL